MRMPVIVVGLVLGIALFSVSCQKDLSCETCSNAANVAPKAVAGADQVIQLPVDSILLDARASSDPDGKIAAYRWRVMEGPGAPIIARPTDSITRVRSLLAGQYQFELTVTDNGGLTARDTIKVTVRAQGQQNQPPVACAGPDQRITLPVNTVTLDGRCSADPDNDIASYLWTKLSGPASLRISNPELPLTPVTDLSVGTYLFLLSVRDASGLQSTDTISVTVSPLWVFTDSLDIYVAGNEYSLPKYWKNGQGVPLKISGQNGNATDIAVEGNDVYVAGWEGDYLYMRDNRAKYWKNGQEVFLTGATGAGANAIAVSGNDVFVAGWELKSQPGISVAKYWKNGVAVALTDGTREAEATDIALVNGDVFVSGYDGDVAKVWRNGEVVGPTIATNPSYASGIAVSGADIYLAGMKDGKPAYWKNNEVYTLSSDEGRASAVFVSGTDVYVAGELRMMLDGYLALYWKNRQDVALPIGQGGTSIATSIFVAGNDVFVAGIQEFSSDFRGGFWRNGQFVQIGSPGGSQLFSIVVKPR